MRSADWSTAASAPWTSPSLLDLVPELSDEEKQRLQWRGLLPSEHYIPWTRRYQAPRLGQDDEKIISTVCDALYRYNVRHPGDEFDIVKPLAQDSLYSAGDLQVWLHMNFWARSRNSKRIKRFFAEVHYKPSPWVHQYSPDLSVNVVESCCIIEEPLARYRKSCPCCRGYFDILHPMDDRQFVCGNGNANDWMIKDFFGIRFISSRDPADPNSQMMDEDT